MAERRMPGLRLQGLLEAFRVRTEAGDPPELIYTVQPSVSVGNADEMVPYFMGPRAFCGDYRVSGMIPGSIGDQWEVVAGERGCEVRIQLLASDVSDVFCFWTSVPGGSPWVPPAWVTRTEVELSQQTRERVLTRVFYGGAGIDYTTSGGFYTVGGGALGAGFGNTQFAGGRWLYLAPGVSLYWQYVEGPGVLTGIEIRERPVPPMP